MDATDNPLLRIADLRVDPSLDEICKDGVILKLEPRAMRLLVCLAEHAGQVLSVDTLLDLVWKDVIVSPDSVYAAVAALRRTLGDDPKQPKYIANVVRRGYRLIAPVSKWEAPPAEPAAPSEPAAPPGEPAAPSAKPTAPSGEPAAPLGTVAGPGTGSGGSAGAALQGSAVAAAFWRSRPAMLLILAVAVIAAGFLAGRLLTSRRAADTAQAPSPVVHTGPPARAAIPEKSIAVLPFLDLSEQHDQEYFSDGLAEELSDLLAQVPDLHVSARTSAFYFKGKQAPLDEIARALGVANLLEGSVRKSGNTLRVTVQLIRTDSGYHLWSKTFDREMQDIFKMQDEIAGAVVTALKAKLAPTQAAAYRTPNAEAYNQFLLGRQLHRRVDLDGVRRAVEAYRKAIALDPNYAAAYAELAIAESFVASGTGDAAGLDRAMLDAQKAVAIAPGEPDGYAARADLRASYMWDFAGAQADLAKALALDPSDNVIRRRYGYLLGSLGRLPEAIAALRKAIELDPLSTPAWGRLGRYLTFTRDFAAADEALRWALEIQPESSYALMSLGTLQLQEGHAAQALVTFGKVSVVGLRLAGGALAEHTMGHVQASQQALGELIDKYPQEAAYQIAQVYAWRADRDQAFAWLDRAYRQRDGGLSDIKFDPLLGSLRADPRYDAMLRTMRLPE
jgi:TolB-like protein/DNA-binding winged helix-turn-helix (wHTH) protein/Tfp pilus assembly protein PilF